MENKRKLSAESAMYGPAQTNIFIEGKRRALHTNERHSDSINYKFLRTLLPKKAPLILDVGCGTGMRSIQTKKSIPNARIVAMDINHALLSQLRKFCKSSSSFHLICGTATALPFQNNSFDLVKVDSTLWAIVDKSTVLKECTRVLKKNGVLVIRNHDSSVLLNLAHPQLPLEVQKLENAVLKLFQKWKYDPFLGHKLFSIVKKTKLCILRSDSTIIQYVGKTLKRECKRKSLLIQQVLPALLKNGYLSRREVIIAQQKRADWSKAPDATSYRLYFTVYARK